MNIEMLRYFTDTVSKLLSFYFKAVKVQTPCLFRNYDFITDRDVIPNLYDSFSVLQLPNKRIDDSFFFFFFFLKHWVSYTIQIPEMLGHFLNLNKMKTKRLSNNMSQYFIHNRT